jgi:hypothetical protein
MLIHIGKKVHEGSFPPVGVRVTAQLDDDRHKVMKRLQRASQRHGGKG